MLRALIQLINKNKAILDPEEIHHLVRVRRAKLEDPFLGLDGRGKLYRCCLQKNDQGWFARVLGEVESTGESSLKIILGQALIKKDKFEWVIQKATELGISTIVPLITGRTEVRLSGPGEDRKIRRWKRVLLEAVKQSKRSHIPELSNPIDLKAYLETTSAAVKLFLDEKKGIQLKKIIEENRQKSSWMVLIGPEGGWSKSDREIFKQYQVYPVHLGARILRTETAPVAILSILQYELGDL